MIPETLVVVGGLAVLFGAVRADDKKKGAKAPAEPSDEPTQPRLRGRSRMKP